MFGFSFNTSTKILFQLVAKVKFLVIIQVF